MFTSFRFPLSLSLFLHIYELFKIHRIFFWHSPSKQLPFRLYEEFFFFLSFLLVYMSSSQQDLYSTNQWISVGR